MMKKIFPWLVFVVVAAQVAWLGWNYHARSLEFATAPRCRIAVSTYDPRDLTRGYYQRLQLNRHYALADAAALFGASIDQRGLREEMMQQCSKEEPYLHYGVALRKDYTPDIHHSATATTISRDSFCEFTLISFWKKQESGLWEICRLEHVNSPEDSPHEGEIRIPMEAHWWVEDEVNHSQQKYIISPELRLNFIGICNLRYYYPEKAGDFFSLLRKKTAEAQENDTAPRHVDITVELLIRPRRNIIPTQLYLNDIPYNEAAELLKQDKFPFRPAPAPATSEQPSE